MTMNGPAYRIHVELGGGYDVHIGTFLLERVGEIVRSACGGARACIVTDETVADLYAPLVSQKLSEAGYEVHTFTFEPGEESKNGTTYLDLLGCLSGHGMTRGDCVVALGGGVAGDLAGFAAATYMRGCRLVQIPTSLLAMVDSSVGGKTAIDLPAGKNLAGAFYQPDAVIADVGCLATLDREIFAAGCSEIVKSACIADAELFRELEGRPLTFDAFTRDVSYGAFVIARTIDIKRRLVEADECERGLRKLLNFGHTAGHAIETASAYTRPHGDCVAAGIALELSSTALQGWIPEGDAARVVSVLKAHGLSCEANISLDELTHRTALDKKRVADSIDVPIIRGIGEGSLIRLSMEQLGLFLADGLRALGGISGPSAQG